MMRKHYIKRIKPWQICYQTEVTVRSLVEPIKNWLRLSSASLKIITALQANWLGIIWWLMSRKMVRVSYLTRLICSTGHTSTPSRCEKNKRKKSKRLSCRWQNIGSHTTQLVANATDHTAQGIACTTNGLHAVRQINKKLTSRSIK